MMSIIAAAEVRPLLLVRRRGAHGDRFCSAPADVDLTVSPLVNHPRRQCADRPVSRSNSPLIWVAFLLAPSTPHW